MAGDATASWYELVVAGRVVGAGRDLTRLAVKLRDIAGAVESLCGLEPESTSTEGYS